ncbi:unnamed protein product [Heterobilharzia americana]|nr:unnamed protein product [Heterobilharzia americana]
MPQLSSAEYSDFYVTSKYTHCQKVHVEISIFMLLVSCFVVQTDCFQFVIINSDYSHSHLSSKNDSLTRTRHVSAKKNHFFSTTSLSSCTVVFILSKVTDNCIKKLLGQCSNYTIGVGGGICSSGTDRKWVIE